MKKEIVQERVVLLESFIDRQLKIADLIHEKGLGKISGRQMACPFHDDISPSMFVDVVENKFYCHSCRRGGRYAKLYEHWATILDNRKVTYYDVLEEILKSNPLTAHHVGFHSIFKSRQELLDLTSLVIEVKPRRSIQTVHEHELPIKVKAKKVVHEYKKGKRTLDSMLDVFAQLQKEGKADFYGNKDLQLNKVEKEITLDDLMDTML